MKIYCFMCGNRKSRKGSKGRRFIECKTKRKLYHYFCKDCQKLIEHAWQRDKKQRRLYYGTAIEVKR